MAADKNEDTKSPEEKKQNKEKRQKTRDELHDKHRQGMLDRVRRFGFESLRIHEQLEVILYNPIPRINTNGIARELIDRFGSLYNVLTADPELLQEVDGIGPRAAKYLNSLFDIAGAVQRAEIENESKNLGSAEEAGKYAASLFYGKVSEYLYIVSLNSFKRVISVDRISSENAKQVTTTVAYIAKMALLRHASYIMLAHNHPGGTFEPSVSDMQMQRAVYEGLNTLSIKLEYNFIVARGQARCIFDRNNMIGI